MDKIPKLGQLITDEQYRDAVHIAVAPVVAGMCLNPGEHIGFTSEGDAYTVVTNAKKLLGIVDPFLDVAVNEGDKFYMFLYPQTITSLRHEWTHPAFEAEEEMAEYLPTFHKLKGAVEEEKWVAEFAERIGTNYNALMDAAHNYLKHGDYFVQGGDFEGFSIPDEFWEKYEAITREKIAEYDRGSFLSCSC